jgi:hypothetical protein
MQKKLQAKIRSKMKKDSNGCWIWQGYRRGSDYAGIWHQGNNRYAHRVSYEAFVGEIPADGFVHHTCGTRLCVNPKHLQCTTWDQNYAEMTVRKSLVARIAELEKEVEQLRSELQCRK